MRIRYFSIRRPAPWISNSAVLNPDDVRKDFIYENFNFPLHSFSHIFKHERLCATGISRKTRTCLRRRRHIGTRYSQGRRLPCRALCCQLQHELHDRKGWDPSQPRHFCRSYDDAERTRPTSTSRHLSSTRLRSAAPIPETCSSGKTRPRLWQRRHTGTRHSQRRLLPCRALRNPFQQFQLHDRKG